MATGRIRHWKHGWIPLDAQARAAKAGSPVGKDFRSMTPEDKIKAAEVMHGTGSPQHIEAIKRFSPPSGSPVGKDFRSMTPEEKIRAAEIMYGTGSPQHRAAIKRFRKT